MKKRSFWLDCILGTGFIYALLGLLVGVSSFAVFEIFDPIGEALGDMQMTDPVFSRLREDPAVDTSIVIVNVGNIPRAGIAEQVNIINQYEPAVIALDMKFSYLKTGSPEEIFADSLLAQALRRVDNLVLVSELLRTDSLSGVENVDPLHYDSIKYSASIFRSNAHFAFANLETKAVSQQDFKACRRFPPKMMVNGKQELAFATQIAQMVQPKSVENFLKRENQWEVINYRGNVVDFYGASAYPGRFFVLDVADIFNENFTPTLLKDKIVILGYMGDDLTDTSWDDKFFTPLNVKYAGKANPDMYGVVIHANIVSMILNQDFIDTFSENTELLISIVMCFLNVVLFSLIYRRLPKWYDGLTKLIQLVEILFFVFLMIMMFYWFNFKLNLTYTIGVVALSGDALEVYYGVLKNLFNKEERRQLFTLQRI